MPDNLHPNKDGAGILAKTVYQRLIGDFGGLQIPDVFNNKMVLQRGIPIPVYGTANRGDKISVEFAGEIKSVETNKFGKWRVEFPAKKSGGSYSIKIENKDSRIILEDILIGDLWLCSGQSNMSFALKSTARAKDEIPLANYPEIRLFNMKTVAWGGKYKWSKEQLDKTNELEFFSGEWETCTPETATDFSAIAYHFGRKVHTETGVPIGLIHNSKGGSPTEAWIDRKTLEFHPQLVDVLMHWEKNDFVQAFCKERAVFNNQNSANKKQRHPFHPAYLYESGIEPLKGLPIKGVVWYQGESNAHNVEFHEQLFPALVESWRNIWGEDLPFYFVQLSGINRPSWGHFRDSQRRLAEQITNCTMAVSSDVGHPTNVHPAKKKEVGERMALIALKNDYGKDVQWQGPDVEKVDFKNNKIVIKYTFAEELKTSDGKPLRSFEVAGEDEIYKQAKTKITGKTIEVWLDEILNPKHFRYGWSAYTDANLINEAGLPASTFSTEFE
jgi:sialate O-acetylesterase